ncbi:sugar phosphate isomerase/epimerase family protein [Kitasatospora sp. NPDC092286]|uniref:sugar phosphate isomerase/epimerase family protein n=1 Tax=Kitasatospora sp. NPDC092286 TaxID=3364087 RepID=UPI00381DFFE3
MKSSHETRSLPFVAGVAVQRYLAAEDGLTAAHEEGCSHWYIDASLLSDMPHNWSESRARNLVAAAAEHGLAPLLHGNFRAPLASEIPEIQAASLQYLRREIDLAARLEATALIVHGGAFVEPRPTKAQRDAALERFLSLLSVVVREAGERGVTVWLENLSYYPKYRPFSYVFTRESDFAAALAAIPGIRFILDVGHANVNQSLAVPAFEQFASSIAALSLSNNSGDQDAHLALDEGTLSMRAITDTIRARDWKGIIAFETRNESVKAGIDYLATLWEPGPRSGHR